MHSIKVIFLADEPNQFMTIIPTWRKSFVFNDYPVHVSAHMLHHNKFDFQYVSLMDETPSYMGGKGNSWRKLTLDGKLKKWFHSISSSIIFKLT